MTHAPMNRGYTRGAGKPIGDGTPAAVRGGARSARFLLDGFDLEHDLNLLAHDEAAAVENPVPAHPEVLAVHLSVRGEGAPLVPALILDDAAELGVQTLTEEEWVKLAG